MESPSNDALARIIWQYHAGKILQYFDLTGKKKNGILVGMCFHHQTQETVALFRSSKFLNRLLFPPTKIPLRLILLPAINTHRKPTGSTEYTRVLTQTQTSRPSSSSRRSNTALLGESTRPQSGNSFNYYNNFYLVTHLQNFKAGEEVVWTNYSVGDVACMGSILVTAECQDAMNNHHDYQGEVAIVRFETPPISTSGCKSPGYFAYLAGVYNTYVVPMRELLKLSEWIAITAKEGNDEENWALVQIRDHAISQTKERPRTDVSKSNNDDTLHEDLCHSSYSFMDSSARKNICSQKQERPKSLHDSVSFTEVADEFLPRWDNEWLLPLNCEMFFIRIQQANGFGTGVQGNNNSCYMDSSLFAIFSFNKSFDSCLQQLQDENGKGLANKVKKVLRDDIVFPMRQKHFVPYNQVHSLRKILVKQINANYSNQFMDVEEFIADLFNLMDTPPFITYDNGEGDHIHQIALPITWEKDQFLPYLSLQSLLENSFETFDVKLTTRPQGGFIIKLPVSNGVLIPSNGVIPNLSLNLSSVSSPTYSTGSCDLIMNLCAVICLKGNHFVTFVKTGMEKNSPWVFMDSNPGMQYPYVAILPEVDNCIIRALSEVDDGILLPLTINTFEPQCGNFSLFTNAYICLYV